MERIAELIDRRDAHELVAAVDQNARVACERRRIAGHRNHDRHGAFDQFARLRLGALARRIEHDGVEALEFRGHEGTAKQVAHLRFHRLQAAGVRRRARQRLDRALLDIRGGDARALGQPQCKGADAGKQVGDAFGAAHVVEHQPRQRRFARGGRLQECAGRQRHLRAPDFQQRLRGLRHQFAVPGDARELVLVGDAGQRRRAPGVKRAGAAHVHVHAGIGRRHLDVERLVGGLQEFRQSPRPPRWRRRGGAQGSGSGRWQRCDARAAP